MPTAETLNGTGLSSGMEAWAPAPSRGLEATLPTELRTPPSQGVMGQRMALRRAKEDVRQGRRAEGGPSRGRVAECHDGGRMERDHP